MKVYLLALVDYEDFNPIVVYADKDLAEARAKEENDKINLGRKRQKERLQAGGEYYSAPWYSSSESVQVYEVDYV